MRALTSTVTRTIARKRDVALLATFLLAWGLPETSAKADSLQLLGYSGLLGEWELTATVTDEGSSAARQYSGPLSMKHVGLCTQDGPEERTGKIRVRIAPSSTRLEATLWVDGVECDYTGNLADFYSGTMSCPGRETVPLKVWLK